MSFCIRDIRTEGMMTPLGIDEKEPEFSWKLESEEKGIFQSACRVKVTDAEHGERMMWDSGKISGSVPAVIYAGEKLQPQTRYRVSVEVWDEKKRSAFDTSFFETGFLEKYIECWPGCQWIAAPEQSVCADTRGVFVAETAFNLEPGSKRAGMVFGANDYRLRQSYLNEYQLSGDNYIRYELNLESTQTAGPALEIYRVGYAKEDRADKPFAVVPLDKFCKQDGSRLMNERSLYIKHKLRVEVEGNQALAYLDDVLVDGTVLEDIRGKRIQGRILNPRGENDVPTYPRLNEIGFFAGSGDSARFYYYQVKNLRTPGDTYILEKPDGGMNGRESLFSDLVDKDKKFFHVCGKQITVDPSHTSSPMFRRNFYVKKELKKARLYITSRGIYNFLINGRTATDRLLTPGLTQYDKRLNYQVYDITDLLHTGENGIGVTLSSGWWSDAQTFTVKNYNYFGDREALLCQIILSFQDETEECFGSNCKEWKYYGDGPYIYGGLFNGEVYDARRDWVRREYSKPDFDDSQWKKPVNYETVFIRGYDPGFGRKWPNVNKTRPILEGGYDAPVYVVKKRQAQTMIMIEPGVYIYDFGQVMAGVPRILLKEERGRKVLLRYGEMLYPDLSRYGENAGRLLTENYRDAASTDRYICSGEAGEMYQPTFTFHGYRYLEISGVSNPPKPDEVVSLQYSSIEAFEGFFQCSNLLLNRFAENVKWSQWCNFINIPTDCPQRNERMGWAGDTHVFLKTALQNARLKEFYERNLTAMADLQQEDGRFPEIAPIGGGFGGITYECAPVFMTYELYRQYGDVRTVARFYPYLKKYMDYMENKGLPGRGQEESLGPLGDWLAFQETDRQLMWNGFYYREADLMSRMADVLGNEEDNLKYRKLATDIKNYWQKTFVDQYSGKTLGMDGQLCDTQCSYAIGICYGLFDDIKTAAAHLAENVHRSDFHVETGFFGTGLVCQALSEGGFVEEAYRMLLQREFPSWLYPVTQGATTVWEHWDSFTRENGFGEYNSMNSFNHYSLGSVLLWMYEWILGIRQGENSQTVYLKPVPAFLSHAEGSVSRAEGPIRCAWEVENGYFELSCEIPANMKAVVELPDGSRKNIGSGKYNMGCEMTR